MEQEEIKRRRKKDESEMNLIYNQNKVKEKELERREDVLFGAHARVVFLFLHRVLDTYVYFATQDYVSLQLWTSETFSIRDTLSQN